MVFRIFGVLLVQLSAYGRCCRAVSAGGVENTYLPPFQLPRFGPVLPETGPKRLLPQSSTSGWWAIGAAIFLWKESTQGVSGHFSLWWQMSCFGAVSCKTTQKQVLARQRLADGVSYA
jgi:hypothetical protein